MDLTSKMRVLAAALEEQVDNAKGNEQATKDALIRPFLREMGYNPNNLNHVYPEYPADLRGRGERVDFALMSDGNQATPDIFMECKSADVDLGNEHRDQLKKYLSTTPEVGFGILTNGKIYQFYAELEHPNIMDSSPVFTFNILNFEDRDAEKLSAFTREHFERNATQAKVRRIHIVNRLKKGIEEQLETPGTAFVRLLLSGMPQSISGVRRAITGRVVQTFSEYAREAVEEYKADLLKSYSVPPEEIREAAESPEVAVPQNRTPTQEELAGLKAIRAICSGIVEASDIISVTNRNFSTIYIKRRNRHERLCRIRLHKMPWRLYIWGGREVRWNPVDLESVVSLYQYQDQIRRKAQALIR